MSNISLYQPLQVVSLKNTTDVSQILSHNQTLGNKDIQNIQKALSNELYSMAAEYIWNRTIAILKSYIMQFGSDFVSEMLDRSDVITAENISNHEVIHLAFNLGFIDKAGRIELTQFDEIFTYYWTDSDTHEEKEFPVTKVPDIIRACVEYVLQFGKSNPISSFSDFRERLKTEKVDRDDQFISDLRSSSHFYRKTTLKTVLNLAKTIEDGAEQDFVLANMVVIITQIWDLLNSEEKWNVGTEYTQANAEGKKPRLKALKSILMQVHGFDYVPENLRSNSYIKVAKNLLTTHYSMNNFHNEITYARELAQMGTSIPAPAIGACLTSILACKIGNGYGVAWSAQEYLDQILKGITVDRWEYYLNQVLPFSSDILFKLSQHDEREDNWNSIVTKYSLNTMNIINSDIQYILDENNRSSGRARKRAYEMYNRLNG